MAHISLSLSCRLGRFYDFLTPELFLLYSCDVALSVGLQVEYHPWPVTDLDAPSCPSYYDEERAEASLPAHGTWIIHSFTDPIPPPTKAVVVSLFLSSEQCLRSIPVLTYSISFPIMAC